MSGTKFDINPAGLSSEISAHRSRNSTVTSVRYRADIGSLNLRSASELASCLGRLDAAMTRFNGIVDRDIQNLERIKNEFVRTDAQMGSQMDILSLPSSGSQNSPAWPQGNR